MDLRYLKRTRQGDPGTHKLLLNPIPTLQLCCAYAARQEAGAGEHEVSLTGVSGSRASRPADGPSTKRLPCLVLSPWLAPLAYLLQNIGLVEIDHLGISECLILQVHSLGLQVSSVEETRTEQAGLVRMGAGTLQRTLGALRQPLVQPAGLQGLGPMESDEAFSEGVSLGSYPGALRRLTPEWALQPGGYCSEPPPEVSGSAHGPMRVKLRSPPSGAGRGPEGR